MSISANPFASGFVTVRYSLPRGGPVALTVYDVCGRVVAARAFTAGKFGAVSLDLRELSGGVYLVKFDCGDLAVTQKLVVQR